jgi:hypothetical protein
MKIRIMFAIMSALVGALSLSAPARANVVYDLIFTPISGLGTSGGSGELSFVNPVGSGLQSYSPGPTVESFKLRFNERIWERVFLERKFV